MKPRNKYYSILRCSYCKCEFQRLKSQIGRSKSIFCSKTCKGKSMEKKKAILKCYNCGVVFERKKTDVGSGNHFCSVQCDYDNRLKMKISMNNVFSLLASGHTVREVSNISGVSYTTLNKMLANRDYKIKKRKERSRNKKVNKYKRETTPVQDINEMDIMGKFGIKPEWRLPSIIREETEFNKWEYFELVGINPKFTEMKKIYYANITYTTTENKRDVTKSSKEVCVGETLDEVLSYEQGLERLKHSIRKKCKNDFNIISVEPISYLGDVNSSVSKNQLK